MRSTENSHEESGKLPLSALLTVLALGACDSPEEIASREAFLATIGREEGRARSEGPEKERMRAEHALMVAKKVEEPLALDYDSPICAHVRSTKAALDALDDPSKESARRKRGRSKVVDVESKRGAGGSRSDRVMVGSGSGTPDDVRARAEVVDRFFGAARAAGGLRQAMDICFKRTGSREQ